MLDYILGALSVSVGDTYCVSGGAMSTESPDIIVRPSRRMKTGWKFPGGKRRPPGPYPARCDSLGTNKNDSNRALSIKPH